MDFSKYEEAKVGAVSKTTISAISEGKGKDFRTEGYWENTNLTKQQIGDAKEQPAIEIKTENGASMVMNMPKGKVIHPKSTLAKFKKTYGAYPSEGLSVDTKLDENGFNRIVIEG